MPDQSITADQFILLIARSERRLRSFLTALIAFDAEAIDDVVQTSCLVAWKKIGSFRYQSASPDEEFVRWLCTIARLEAMQYLRSAKRRPAVFDQRLIAQIADRQLEESEYFEARKQALATCVDRLSDRQRDTLRLRYGLGLSCNEVGRRQGKQAAAVANALARIRVALEQCVEAALRREGYG